jgi:hypothetical protein
MKMNMNFTPQTMMFNLNRSGKRLAMVLILGVATLSVSCDDLLSVSDPGAIQEKDLENPATEQLIVNGALSEWQYAYDYMTLTASIFSDEIFTDHTNIDHREFALHNFPNTNALNNGTYSNLHKARATAEDGVTRLKAFHGAAATSNLNIAELLTYAGYSYTLLGEHFCESPVNGSKAYSSEELLGFALERFDEAIAVASSGQASNPTRATTILNTARVGAGRAALQLGQMQKAISYASAVPANFERAINRSTNSARESAIMGAQWASASGAWAGVSPRFRAMNDPRVRYTAAPRLGLNARPVHLPYLPFSFVGWSATSNEQIIALTSKVKYSTGLEARYIVAEASGATPQTLAFVNERRQFAAQPAVTLSGNELMAELREQRSRDFFLSVQRHGDLRRYIKLNNIDLFPKGSYPVTSEQYGTQRCFIIPLSEISANPNLR